jgi:enoyl-CoA hydratase/carnithine racemase
MMSQDILFELDSTTGVATLTLNRPERFNAFNQQMVNQWADHLEEARKNADIKAIIVTGAGKAFCAGGDIEELESFLSMSAAEKKAFLWENVHRIPLALQRVDRPVIAALNGTARGAGLDMALMCDLRVAERSAVFAESYIAMGVLAGDGGCYFLPRLVGVSRALELLWTGDSISATEAERIGMVSRVVDDGQALASARTLAEKIAKQPTAAIQFIKRTTYQSLTMPLDAHLDMISSHMAVLEDMPDFRKRVLAFKERKR